VEEWGMLVLCQEQKIVQCLEETSRPKNLCLVTAVEHYEV